MNYTIKTGTQLIIKESMWKENIKIMYSGMPNESTFVLSLIVANGAHGYSTPVFFSTVNTVIQLMEMEFNVYEVNSDYIIIGD